MGFPVQGGLNKKLHSINAFSLKYTERFLKNNPECGYDSHDLQILLLLILKLKISDKN